jgi:hypothetical protein
MGLGLYHQDHHLESNYASTNVFNGSYEYS